MSNSVAEQKFSKLRSALWPIHNFELKKFLPLTIMMIFVLFNYTIFRDLKDTLVQTSMIGGGGSETLSTLKTYFVLPISFVFMAVFMKVSNKLSPKTIFYGIFSFFIAFCLIFGFVFFPNGNMIHPSIETVQTFQAKFPRFHYVVPCLTNWDISWFYIMAELWGTVVIGLLYWGFINSITKTTEAKRFYSLFGMLGNLGLILAGEFVHYLAKHNSHGLSDTVFFQSIVRNEMIAAAISGIVIMGLYAFMQKKVLTDPRLYVPEEIIKKKKKPKMGMWESIKYVITSPYVLLIATLVFSYGMSTVLIEQLWKSQVRIAFPNGADYANFMARYSENTGILTMIIMMVGMNVLKNCKWKTSALVTPLFTGIAGIIMFALMLFQKKFGSDALIFGASALMACVWAGAFQIGGAKGIKYSMFDATKNIAYLPLSSEEKTKSQAAVEVVGSRFGKSGASTLVVLLTGIIFPKTKITDGFNMQFIMGACILVILLWMLAVIKINPTVMKKMKEKEEEEKEAQVAASASSISAN